MLITKYIFWLAIISTLIAFIERIKPWRKQKFLRDQLPQDFFWLLFNGYFSKIILHDLLPILPLIFSGISLSFKSVAGVPLQSVAWLSNSHLIVQFAIYFILADFIEWLVHNMLHRIGFLWNIHRVHHSIKTMDWIGNFRFHWGETIIYSTFKYLPIALLGVSWQIILIGAVVATTIGHLNHSNIRISWGPLRFIFNSPRMHIWHHDIKVRGKGGVNFGVVFSVWDWLFKTAYMPMELEGPEEIGYHGEQNVPSSLPFRFFLPFFSRKN